MKNKILTKQFMHQLGCPLNIIAKTGKTQYNFDPKMNIYGNFLYIYLYLTYIFVVKLHTVLICQI